MKKVILYIVGVVCLFAAFAILALGSFQRATLPVVLISLFGLGFTAVACLSFAEVEEWEEAQGRLIKKVRRKNMTSKEATIHVDIDSRGKLTCEMEGTNLSINAALVFLINEFAKAEEVDALTKIEFLKEIMSEVYGKNIKEEQK